MSKILAFAVSALLAASAFAADLDADEKKWVGQCVENLASKSALVRGSAEKAIGALGIDALPAVVAASVKLKSEADWQALSRAVAAMGPGARKALDGLKPSWPKGTPMHFVEMLDFLEAAEAKAKKDAPVALPTSPAEVEAAVKQILENYRGRNEMSSEDPDIKKLIALGHPAVGAILEFLNSAGPSHEEWSETYAATTALAALAEPGDVPALAAMLRQGRTTAAHGLENIDSPEAVDALVDAIHRSLVDEHLMGGIERKVKDPEIQKALCGWLRKPAAAENEYIVGQSAELLARNAVTYAVPSLLPHLAGLTQLQPRQRVALALADLGEKAGIPALIDVLTAPDDHGVHRFDYPRHCAGLALNEIAGSEIYTGKAVDRDTQKPSPPEYDADWAATATAFRVWWATVKGSIHFDLATRRWSVK